MPATAYRPAIGSILASSSDAPVIEIVDRASLVPHPRHAAKRVPFVDPTGQERGRMRVAPDNDRTAWPLCGAGCKTTRLSRVGVTVDGAATYRLA